MEIKFGKKYEVWYGGKMIIMVCRQDPDEHAMLTVEGKPDAKEPFPPLIIKEIKTEE